jgi:hypothetical protein
MAIDQWAGPTSGEGGPALSIVPLDRVHEADPPAPMGFADHWAMMALGALHEITRDQWYVQQLRYLPSCFLVLHLGQAGKVHLLF